MAKRRRRTLHCDAVRKAFRLILVPFVSASIVALFCYLVWFQPWMRLSATSPPPACIVENGKGKVGLSQCCKGLQSQNTGNIFNRQTGGCSNGNSFKFFCTHCGDGTCDKGENECTCSKDCKRKCIKEGMRMDRYDNCCSGLQAENTGNKYNKTGKLCTNGDSGKYICTKCGNHTCDDGESFCTCPTDCPLPQGPCIKLGATGTVGVDTCCGDLKPENTGNKYNATTKQCSMGNSFRFVCAECGNGTCDTGENRCTCKKDCSSSS